MRGYAFRPLPGGETSDTNLLGGQAVYEERHVVPSPDGGWDLLAEDAARVASHHATPREAVRQARAVLLDDEGGGELLLHDSDGDIRAKVSFRASSNATEAGPPTNFEDQAAAKREV